VSAAAVHPLQRPPSLFLPLAVGLALVLVLGTEGQQVGAEAQHTGPQGDWQRFTCLHRHSRLCMTLLLLLSPPLVEGVVVPILAHY
jgi:hypothetical protein